jgi:tungstate transport system permease protein
VGFILQSLADAVRLIAGGDADLLAAIGTTLRVSLASTAIASAIGLPLAVGLALHDFRGKRVVLVALRTALAFPTVAIGLLVYAFLTRNGPLGTLHLLFTRTAIVIGQVLLIVPLITALAHAALQHRARTVREEAILLGAGSRTASLETIREMRFGVLTALLTGFGRVVSEVGVALILGGNIRGLTRTLTTAITLETSQGDFARAFALALVLLLLVLAINLLLLLEARRGRMD